MNKRLKRPGVVVCLILATLLLASGAAVQAAQRTVRIGYYYDSDYFYKNEDGSYHGYDAEYLYEISKYTDWTCQYVDYNSFEEVYAALEKGEIDVLPALFYSEERAQSLLLSSHDMGSIYVTVVVSDKNDTIAYGDTQALQGKKVGILTGSVDGERFRSWAAEQSINADIVAVSSEDELLQSLDNGSLDAVAISYLGSGSTYRIVDEFSPMPMYFGMPKDHEALMNELNQAAEKIAIETPDFTSDLYSRYYVANQKQTPVFSEDEKRYIAGHPTLTVALEKDDAPFSYQNKDGSLSGAVVDYYDQIAKLSGLTFTYTGVDSEQAALDAVKDGQASIAGFVVYNASTALSDHILLTNAYLTTTLTQLSRKGVATPKSLAIPAYLAATYKAQPDSGTTPSLTTYATADDCFRALRRGEVDGALLSAFSANYYLNTERAGTYNLSPLNGMSCRVAAGLSATSDRSLYTVLNRCIRFSNTAMNQLVLSHSQADSTSLQSVLNRIPSSVLAALAAILLFLVIFLAYAIISMKRHQSEKDAIAAQRLANDRRELELAAVEKNAEEKNQFFSNISHDMRTPINAILGFTRMAMAPDITDEQRNEDLGKVELSGKLLLDLIDDTLTLSRASSDKLTLRPTPVRIRELLDAVTVPVRQAAGEKGITLTVSDEAGGDRLLLADELTVQKVFLNLLTNAVKYTPAGGHVWFTLHCEPEGPDSPRLMVTGTVRDDGIGIAPDFLPHLFEPFVQEKQRGYESVGTGLGLAIVHQMVDLMGGTIAVESHLGEGTTFTVRLPLEEAPDTLPAQPESPPSQADLSELDGKRILLCEDNALNREITCALLNAKGMAADAAENGRLGLERFEASPPGTYSAILMDIRMPVMDGYTAARAIRSLDRPDAGTVPIIAVTADAFADDVEKALEAGMDDHISKPIDPGALYQTLAACVDGAGREVPTGGVENGD